MFSDTGGETGKNQDDAGTKAYCKRQENRSTNRRYRPIDSAQDLFGKRVLDRGRIKRQNPVTQSSIDKEIELRFAFCP